MSIEGAFYYEAVNTVAIAAVIGTRLYPAGGVPSSADKPFAVYQIIGNEHHRHQGGRSLLARPRMQLDCYAATQKTASDLAELFRLAFDGFSGAMGETGSTVTVKVMTLDTENHLYEAPTDGSQGGIYRVSMDFLIWHAEA